MARQKDARQYARFTVDLPANRKLAGAPANVKWTAVVGVLWSVQNLTDGQVTPAIITASAGVPSRVTRDLVNRDIWHEKAHACPDCPQPNVAGDVVIHHFGNHQDSADTVRRNREEKVRSGRLANHIRWKHAGSLEDCGRCAE